MRRTAIALAVSLISLSSPAAFAQTATVDGQVQKIDESAGKITLKHGPIKNLDMDSMTMVFRVKNPSMLKGLKAGDRVKFAAERADGLITITSIQKAK